MKIKIDANVPDGDTCQWEERGVHCCYLMSSGECGLFNNYPNMLIDDNSAVPKYIKVDKCKALTEKYKRGE